MFTNPLKFDRTQTLNLTSPLVNNSWHFCCGTEVKNHDNHLNIWTRNKTFAASHSYVSPGRKTVSVPTLKWFSSVFSFGLRFFPFVSTAHGCPEFCSLATMSRWNCLIYRVQMVILKTGEHPGVSGVPVLIFHMCPSFSDSEFSICLLLISCQNLFSFLWHFGLSSIVRVNLHLLILSELNCVEHDKSKCYLVHSTSLTLTILSSPVLTQGKSHILSWE